MKRSLWIQPLTEQSSPAWPCPACGSGSLALVPKSLVEKETIQSKKLYEVLGEPEEIRYTFSAWLKCSYGDCGEDAVVVGNGKVVIAENGIDYFVEEMTEDSGPHHEYKTLYEPLFCWPMPDIFVLPEKCPKEIKAELCAAFRLFWSDQAASAGRVRVSLERLMDHYHIPKRRKGQDTKYHTLTLHGRIETFSKTRSGAGEKLMALKWLGNTASHQGSVSRDDILDAFEILEYLLAELFERRSIRIEELTRQLTKKHAPRRKK